jgi:ppGpp synthetase/RelA/SpoT-type nucleotidyltranferase
MNGEELRQEYEGRLSDLENMKDRIVISLRQSIDHKKIPFDAVKGRIKEFDSFMEKIRRKDLQNPFQEINDIVGIRVICLYRDDIEKIKNVVSETFDVISDDDKTESRDVDRFGYSGSHIIARLGNEQNSSLQQSLHDLRFEIQIRTIAQHAWASISHHLFYKQSDKIPENQERDFQALSALFYVADSHFLLLKNEHSRREYTQ